MSVGSRQAGIFTTDRSLVVRSWDRWIADATGIAEEEARGRPLVELVPDLEARGLTSRLRRVCDEGTIEVLAPAFHAYLLPCSPRAASAHFTRMQQHVTMAPLRDGEQVVGVLVTVEDVTARRDRERELAAELQSPDDAVRLHAVRTLAMEAGAAGPLSGALGDASWRVRRAAADGLARGSDDASIAALLDAVRERHRDPAVLNAALSALACAEQDVIPALLDAFHAAARDTDLRTYLALALGLLQDPRAVPTLVRALDDGDANVRFHAIEALGRIRARDAALAVAVVAESRDFAVAFAALDTLALMGEPSVAPLIVPILDDDLLHAATAEALGQLGREDVVGPLAAQLGRPGAAVATLAAALDMVHKRFEDAGEQGALVADLARTVVTPEAARRLIDELPMAADAERAALLGVLGWLDLEGVEDTFAQMLAHDATRRTAAELLARRGTAAVPPLLEALTAGDDEVRKAAAAALGRIGAMEAVPALLELLAASSEVAVVAAGALGGIGDARALDALTACLDHPQAAVRRAAAAAIDSIGHGELVDRVGALLTDTSPRVREAAATIAGYFGFAECVMPMLACCRDSDENVRRTAVEQLAHFDDPRALRALTEALRAGTPGVRAAASRGFAHVDSRVALPELRAACSDPDPWVRYYAVRSAGHHRRHEAVPELVRLATSDPVPPVRIAALEALGETGATEALVALHPLAGDDDPMVAQAAIAAISRGGGPAAVPTLLAALAAPELVRQRAALDALDALASRGNGGERSDFDGVEVATAVATLARAAADREVRAHAVHALARIGGPAAVAALIAIAESPLRARAVADALARLDGAQVPWLKRGLAHDDVSVRCVVVEALGRMADPSVATLLAGALDDAAPAVRLAAAQALGRRDLRAARSVSDIVR